jgi:two-component system cell cycle response regulator DivK
MTSDAPGPIVLIVDDNEKNLKLARDVLRAAGLRTLDAATGAQAIELAAKEVPDLVLLDLRLPDMNGVDVARALTGIPVVALSASRFSGDDTELQAAGFAGFLEKPIDVAAFPDQVRSFCARDASTPS